MNTVPGGSQESRFLLTALAYARKGWRVFPLHSVIDGRCSCGKACGERRAKHPRTPHGFQDATTDETQLATGWAAWPDANIGIATGPESGIFVIGPDGQAGIDALAEIEQQYGTLPPTCKV